MFVFRIMFHFSPKTDGVYIYICMIRYYVNRLWCWFRHWTCTHSTRYWILGMQHASLSYSAISINSPFRIWSRPFSSIVLLHASWTVYIPSPRFFHVAFPNFKIPQDHVLWILHVSNTNLPPPPTKNNNMPNISGWWFQIFLFSSLFGEMIQFD